MKIEDYRMKLLAHEARRMCTAAAWQAAQPNRRGKEVSPVSHASIASVVPLQRRAYSAASLPARGRVRASARVTRGQHVPRAQHQAVRAHPAAPSTSAARQRPAVGCDAACVHDACVRDACVHARAYVAAGRLAGGTEPWRPWPSAKVRQRPASRPLSRTPSVEAVETERFGRPGPGLRYVWIYEGFGRSGPDGRYMWLGDGTVWRC